GRVNASDEHGGASTWSSTRNVPIDTQNPTSQASSPQYSTANTFNVSYTASDPDKNGSHTGLKKVEIYVKTPTSGTYSLAHTFDPASGAGNFDYTAAAGDGSYDFYSIAYDNAGNVEAVPVGPDNITIVSQATTLLDTGKPTSTASVPDYENSNTFSVSYTANDPGATASGLDKVELWAEGPLDAAYSKVDTD